MMNSQNQKVIYAGTIGNLLEWFDFAIYGFFAPQIGRHFFPAEDQTAQMLATFGVFAVGYFMRPIGGIVVGHIGDTFGRRAALTFSIAAMAIPTFLIGLLPSYATIGFAAPIMLTLLRMMQGLAVGGEYASSMIFMIEHAPEGRRGFMGALAGASATLGTLLGSAVGAAFAASLSIDDLNSWGWRLPFLAGLFVGIIGYILRRHIVEQELPPKRDLNPLVDTIRNHWRVVMNIIGISFFHAGAFFIILVYLVTWAQEFNGASPSHALSVNTFSMVITMLATILAGYLSDKVGRKPIMIFSAAAGIVCALPLFWLMHGAVFWYGHPHFAIGQIIFAIILGLYYGSLPALLVELAPPNLRCTSVALGYNLCYGLFGGVSPLVATWLVKESGYPAAPAIWIIISATVTLITLFWIKETNVRVIRH